MPRSRSIDRALPVKKRLSRIISVGILLLGAIALIWVFSPGERQRRGALEELEFGDSAQRVAQMFGPPKECPPEPLEHLRGSFREGWSPRSADAALQRMAAETAARWVYPVDRREIGRCDGADGQTEIGLDANRQVLWYVAITGKTSLRLPDEWESVAGGP